MIDLHTDRRQTLTPEIEKKNASALGFHSLSPWEAQRAGGRELGNYLAGRRWPSPAADNWPGCSLLLSLILNCPLQDCTGPRLPHYGRHFISQINSQHTEMSACSWQQAFMTAKVETMSVP